VIILDGHNMLDMLWSLLGLAEMVLLGKIRQFGNG